MTAGRCIALALTLVGCEARIETTTKPKDDTSFLRILRECTTFAEGEGVMLDQNDRPRVRITCDKCDDGQNTCRFTRVQ